jgi:hypothetical protein
VPDTQSSETIPQYSENRLKDCVRAVLEADLNKPVDEWLNGQSHLSECSRRQVRSTLGFVSVLTEPWRQDPKAQLVPEVEAWRSSHGGLVGALAERFREGYTAAGCDKSNASLIGNPALTEEALGRVLRDEPPFKKLKKPETRGNAIRFACHVHRLIVENALVPATIEEDVLSGPRFRNRALDPEPEVFGSKHAPSLNDQRRTANRKKYRIRRVRGDVWLYGRVDFEGPEGVTGPNWIDSLDIEEQAQLLDQLAAKLLDRADSLRQGEIF